MGRPVIGCFPLYPPVELLHAMGLVPAILWDVEPREPVDSPRHLQRFACGVAHRIVDRVLGPQGRALAGLMFYNACDTLRHLPEILAVGLEQQGRRLPLHRLHLPVGSCGEETARVYLRDELHRLQLELERAHGVRLEPAAFDASVALYRRAWQLCTELEQQVARGQRSFESFAGLVQQGHLQPVEDWAEALRLAADRPQRRPEPRARVVVSGILAPSAS
ncbi:MAG: 2-hydroxyacyl-CoA dehydratase, partial [Deltaproteobacteria bacterium]|nr:2-hydroxyacyl-CoA dehydratase [Deltaproteobacteria bacterium]